MNKLFIILVFSLMGTVYGEGENIVPAQDPNGAFLPSDENPIAGANVDTNFTSILQRLNKLEAEYKELNTRIEALEKPVATDSTEAQQVEVQQENQQAEAQSQSESQPQQTEESQPQQPQQVEGQSQQAEVQQ